MESLGIISILLVGIAAVALVIAWIVLPVFVWQLTSEARKTNSILARIEENTRHVAMKLGK